jgi:hypothetical protein
MDEILTVLTEQVLPHWPFVMVTAIFAVIGQVMSKSVFTREQAYKKRSAPWYKFWETQNFWWWGRETLPLHPIMSGALLGCIWQNPEGFDPAWGLPASAAYFAGAGVASLFAWAVAKAILKKKGINLELPGISSNPPPPPAEGDDA